MTVSTTVRHETQIYYTKSGLRRYLIEVEHAGLGRHQEIKGEFEDVVQRKAYAKAGQWDDMWAKRQAVERRRQTAAAKRASLQQKKALAVERTREAQTSLAGIESVLQQTLSVDDTVEWEALMRFEGYPEAKPTPPPPPVAPHRKKLPTRPGLSDPSFKRSLTFLERIIPSKKRERLVSEQSKWDQRKAGAEKDFELSQAAHREVVSRQAKAHQKSMETWTAAERAYLEQRDAGNAAVDQLKAGYEGLDQSAVLEYCELVLSNSSYDDYYPQTFDLQYNVDSKILLVDYELPDIEQMSTLREVKYIQSRDEFDEKHIPDSKRRQLYDGLCYQVALRTVHEVYEADQVGALESVVFNGIVESVDPANGQQTRACVISLQANREEFLGINLAAVDPKACFKSLRGVAASKIHTLTPVAPIIALDRDDSRFVDSYGVAGTIQEGDNLAAMDWEDFEHLIREIFEKEFGESGAEVRVTQASRDAGVDAVVLDPDPLRGGKIVIQAKRYTNTVGVSAVRDLYGTLMNEGANKGILVTTSDYGPDAYQFAKGKPLTLLSGSNLLHLLEKHGHKARIDLKEAKALLAEQE